MCEFLSHFKKKKAAQLLTFILRIHYVISTGNVFAMMSSRVLTWYLL